MDDRTTLDLYRHEVKKPRTRHYVHYQPDVEPKWTSTEAFFQQTSGLSKALGELGVVEGDRVMLLSDNRPEWHMVDLAVASNGAVSVPIYGTLSPSQIEYQVNDSGSKIAVVENAEQMEKFLAIRESCPDLEQLIQIDGAPSEDTLSFHDLSGGAAGESAADRFWNGAEKVTHDDLLTIIYTSGTTGHPKGVMLTHQNLVANVKASRKRAELTDNDLGLEFLPLCHVFERMVGYLFMDAGCSKAYCSVYHVGDMIADIKPTVFASVPRFYEKVYDAIQETVASAPAARRAIFNWALRVGAKARDRRLAGEEPSGLRLALADKLVFSKLRAALGGRVNNCISGGAPLPQFLGEFFHAVGIWLLEGYGLTETSPVIAVNGRGPGELRLGTVGKPLENVDLRIAEDGEVCVKGPSIMKGYWNLPDLTAEVFDDEGFFHTGDIGEIDEDGFLKITDRKKDIIVTAGGKNVAPQPIESECKRSGFVDNVVLIGDKRRYITALISPNSEELERWAKQNGIEYSSLEDLTRHDHVTELYTGVIDQVNRNLARYEQIKKFKILPLMLSVEDGQLTPTLKVKRRVVEKQYAELIDEMYE